MKLITFLLFDDVKHLDVAGPAEVFAEATRAGADYRLNFVTLTGDAVRTSTGLVIGADSTAADARPMHTLVIPGGDGLPHRPVEPELIRAAKDLVGLASRVSSICTGAFLLAATGALDGRKATTHWQHAARLQRSHRSITVEPDSLFISDGHVHTSAGVSAGIDLALALVEADHGRDLARKVAQQLVVYLQRSGGQSQFSSLLQFTRGSADSIRLVTDAIINNPEADHSVATLAALAGLSERHFSRLFTMETGSTPARYVESARLETAKVLLLSGEPVAAVAWKSGFHSPETLRRVFVARLGMPPSTYRRNFSAAGS